MQTITSFYLVPIQAEEISATSLQNDMAENSDEQFECYRLQSEDVAEAGWLIYSAGRAGISWGGDGQWTDASNAEDAAERFLGLNGKEMVK